MTHSKGPQDLFKDIFKQTKPKVVGDKKKTLKKGKPMSQPTVGSSSTDFNNEVTLLLINVSAMMKVIFLIIGSQCFLFYFASSTA